MAVAGTNLTTNSSSSGLTSYTTASITPTANRLVLALVGSDVSSGTPNIPTLTGNGLTWVEAGTLLSGTQRVTLFRGMKSSGLSAGTVVIDFAGQTQTGAGWSISEYSGVNTGGTDGSAAIRQITPGSGTGTSGSIGLGSFSDAADGTFGGFVHNANESSTQGSGFTLNGSTMHAAPGRSYMSEWRADNDSTVDASWTTSAAWFGIAAEVVEASVVPAVTGTAAATFTFTGTASGLRTVQATAAASFSFTGSAQGTRTVAATAAGSYTFTATATGGRVVAGTATGNYSFSATATGSTLKVGTAAGNFTFTGSASGARLVQGAAVGSFTFTASASGVIVGVVRIPVVTGSHALVTEASGSHAAVTEVVGSHGSP